MLEEFIHIFTDPAHIFAELAYESVFLVVGIAWVKGHDRKHHGLEDQIKKSKRLARHPHIG